MFNLKYEVKKINNINGVRDSIIPFLISALLKNNNIFYIAKNDFELSNIHSFLSHNFADINIFKIPAWDCLPYDISSPNFSITSERIKSFSKLCFLKKNKEKKIFLTTINALITKTAPRDFYKKNFISLSNKTEHSLKTLTNFLINTGYKRVQTVRELCEFSLRGSILDVFPIGYPKAFRIDFFGRTIETIKVMDPLTQRSSVHVENINIYSSNEYLLSEENIENFRKKFRSLYANQSIKNSIYEKVSSGIRFNGIEHYLPLLHKEPLCSIFEFLPKDQEITFLLTKNFFKLIAERESEIIHFSEERKTENPEYNLISIEDLYLTTENLKDHLKSFKTINLNEFDQIENNDNHEINLYSKPLIISNYIDTEDTNKINNFVKFCIKKSLDNKKIIIITEENSSINNLIHFFEEDLNNSNIKFDIIEIKDLIYDEPITNFNFSYSAVSPPRVSELTIVESSLSLIGKSIR